MKCVNFRYGQGPKYFRNCCRGWPFEVEDVSYSLKIKNCRQLKVSLKKKVSLISSGYFSKQKVISNE